MKSELNEPTIHRKNTGNHPTNNLSILEIIAENTRRRVETQKINRSLRELMNDATSSRRPQGFASAIIEKKMAVIAEIKRASPSTGVINATLDPVEIAGDYLKNGAAALSILTEPDFFHGDIAFLSRVRAAYPKSYLLLKDFIVDEYQIAQARILGADAILLMASLLPDRELTRLFVFARALGLSPLFEVHDEEELDRVIHLNAPLIGINNRDLKTLEVDLNTSTRLSKKLPKGAVVISESGIANGLEMKRLGTLGFRGVLVGTSLMKEGRPGKALARLISEAAQ